MCLVCTRQKKKLNKIIRKAKQRLLNKRKCAKWLAQHGGELKFSSFPDKNILKDTLKEIVSINLNIYYIAMKKQGKNLKLTDKEVIIGSLFHHIIEKKEGKGQTQVTSN